MILVTGATGTVGREVARRIPADLGVRVMCRKPERLVEAFATAEAVYGDYRDPQSLAGALRGVRTAFLVTTGVGGDEDAAFVQTARSAGVRHVVKLSAAAVEDPRADDLITRWQRRNEELLRCSGMEWTLLRPRSFMSNTLSWAASLRTDGVVRALCGSSGNACVDPRDIADVAVRALTGEGHAGRAYTLTGPEAITAAEQTAVLGQLLGRQLRFEELEPEQARTALRARYPHELAEALLDSAERQRAGAKARVDRTVPALLGRPAGSFHAWARDHLSAFV
ncbi:MULTISPECIES: NAD(P)H-binding protein [unclassified Streptomyces]|uniref:NAD(P)H-binding protein n=1 Tax=unclassified Streptomyces TaxID=2593676 RepID=UPI002E11E0F4|nr:NAD(P)H-binding protein [Streptomyces sp. NBC_01205]